jgi:hypothetical protein
VTAGKLKSIDLSSTDVDHDPINILFAQKLPSFTSFNTKNSILTFAPGFNDFGEYPVTVSVLDAYGNTTETFSLSVVNNSAPIMSCSSDPIEISVPMLDTLTVSAPYYSDPDDNPVSLTSFTDLPEFISISDSDLEIAPTLSS